MKNGDNRIGIGWVPVLLLLLWFVAPSVAGAADEIAPKGVDATRMALQYGNIVMAGECPADSDCVQDHCPDCTTSISLLVPNNIGWMTLAPVMQRPCAACTDIVKESPPILPYRPPITG